MKKKRLKPIILVILILLFATTLSISLYNIINWNKDNQKTNEKIEEIIERVDIEETPDNDETIVIEPIVEEEKENLYWSYIKMNLIDVNFTELKKLNSNIKGWIQVNGTNINYPFVQTTNNSYYLTHSIDKSYNQAGWIFMDYRNKNDFSDKNTIIYGHNRLDKTMFGSLKNVLKSGWLKNSNNFIIKTSTEKENSLWQIFSIYHIETTSDYLKTNFSNDTEYQEFLDMLIGRTMYDFKITISSADKILTLSSCYSNYEKIVVHAKLIKSQKK